MYPDRVDSDWCQSVSVALNIATTANAEGEDVKFVDGLAGHSDAGTSVAILLFTFLLSNT
jgi:hypothetical protein